MRRGARLVIALAIVVAVVVTLVACSPPDAGTSPGYVSGDGTVTVFHTGQQVDFTGVAYDGTTVDVADYGGQVVLINTWYASCPPCRAEAPDLVAADARDDVQVLGVNTRDDAETAAAFERTFDVHYPSIGDADGAAIAQLQGLVAVNAVPTTVVVGPDGALYARVIGRVEGSTLEGLIDDALAGA